MSSRTNLREQLLPVLLAVAALAACGEPVGLGAGPDPDSAGDAGVEAEPGADAAGPDRDGGGDSAADAGGGDVVDAGGADADENARDDAGPPDGSDVSADAGDAGGDAGQLQPDDAGGSSSEDAGAPLADAGGPMNGDGGGQPAGDAGGATADDAGGATLEDAGFVEDAGQQQDSDAGEPSETDAGAPADAGPGAQPYNRYHVKSTHNSYERTQSLIDQLQVYRVHSLELDIFRSSTAQRWNVKHYSFVGNTTKCGGNGYFSDCLAVLRTFHQANPSHWPVTVFVDLKNDDVNGGPWKSGWSEADFDAQLDSYLGSALFSPGQLGDRCPTGTTLQEKAAGCGWPAMTELRGRLLVVLTDGEGTKNNGARAYLNARGIANARAFSAIDLSAFSEAAGCTAALQLDGRAVFFNMPADGGANLGMSDCARFFFDRNMTTRVWGLNTVAAWNLALSSGCEVNHMGTDSVNCNTSPAYFTHLPDGTFPFFLYSDHDSAPAHTAH